MIDLANAYVDRPEFFAIGIAVARGVLGSLLMGLALVLSRTVPRWQSLTFVVATIGTTLAAPGTPVGPIAFGAVSLVSVFFAVRLVRGHG